MWREKEEEIKKEKERDKKEKGEPGKGGGIGKGKERTENVKEKRERKKIKRELEGDREREDLKERKKKENSVLMRRRDARVTEGIAVTESLFNDGAKSSFHNVCPFYHLRVSSYYLLFITLGYFRRLKNHSLGIWVMCISVRPWEMSQFVFLSIYLSI